MWLNNIYIFQAAKLGEEIFIDAKTLKKGRTLAFLECEIKNAQGKYQMTNILKLGVFIKQYRNTRAYESTN